MFSLPPILGVPLPLLSRRRLTLPFLLFFFLFLQPFHLPFVIPSPFEIFSNAKNSKLPLPLALVTGEWVDKPRLRTNASIVRAWGSEPACPGPDSTRGLAVSSLEWHPDTSFSKWDSLQVIERLVNSANGLLLVGDSVTMQTSEALEFMLRIPPSTWNGRLRNINSSLIYSYTNDYNLRNISLREDSPLHRHLTSKYRHIPPRHLLEPFVRSIRHDTLLAPLEVTALAKEIGFQFPELDLRPWLTGSPWEPELHRQDRMVWEGMKRSVLMINSGAHWSRASFGEAVGKKGVQAIYSRMVETLLPRLPKASDFLTIYRTTSPTHVDCGHRLSPLPLAPAPQEHPLFPLWDWADLNELEYGWSNAVQDETWSQKLVLLNVSEMAGRRPDAHKMNDPEMADCLHWCLPTITGTWVRMLWTLIAREAEL